jgi:hypothetical protein
MTSMCDQEKAPPDIEVGASVRTTDLFVGLADLFSTTTASATIRGFGPFFEPLALPLGAILYRYRDVKKEVGLDLLDHSYSTHT